MKDLNNYIIEKLKINKDTQVKYKPKVGDKCLSVKTIGSKYCYFTIVNINEITDDGEIVVYLKNHGYPDTKYVYYQVDTMENQEFARLSNKNYPGVLMDKDRAYKYLKYLYDSRKGVIKYYFDGKPYRLENPFEKKPMYQFLSTLINYLND